MVADLQWLVVHARPCMLMQVAKCMQLLSKGVPGGGLELCLEGGCFGGGDAAQKPRLTHSSIEARKLMQTDCTTPAAAWWSGVERCGRNCGWQAD